MLRFNVHLLRLTLPKNPIYVGNTCCSVFTTKRFATTLSKPEPPVEGECCGNGCPTCVWITYWDTLADYNKSLDTKSNETTKENNLVEDFGVEKTSLLRTNSN